MALQGDLTSFALPDVLRLLGGTGKTGRLAVAGPAGSGEIWLTEGDLVGGSVTTTAHASTPVDVVFELLRFTSGSFLFDDGEQLVEPGERAGVDDALAAAEGLLAEWTQVEQVVPSMATWVSLAAELTGDEVTVSAKQWRLLAAVGAGTDVRALAERFELTDLAASRKVKALVEAALVEVGEAPEHVEIPGFAEATAFSEAADAEPVEDAAAAHVAHALAEDLALLSAEDGPVVLETREDALLPEPLPGEGTTFDGELEALGTVDGRSFESMEAEAGGLSSLADPTADPDAEDAQWAAYQAFGDIAPEAQAAPERTWGEPEAVEAETPHDDRAEAGEDDRGSLLKFLSTVKP